MPVSQKRGRSGRTKWQKRKKRTWGSKAVQYGVRPGRPPTKFVSRVKKALMSVSETKVKYMAYFFGGGPTATRTFLHDSLNACVIGGTAAAAANYPTSLAGGAGDDQRTGTDIHSLGFRVRGSFGLPFDRRNTTIKIWLVEYNSNQGSITDPAQFYKNVTGNNLIDPINTERFPGVKLLRTLRHKARDLYVERGELTDSGSYATLPYDIWIPWKRHLRYNTTSTENPRSGCKEAIALIMTCYDTFSASSATDTVVVEHDQMVAFYYKDI